MVTFTSAQLDAWIAGAFLPFLRLLALFSAAPILSHKSFPARSRVALAAPVRTVSLRNTASPTLICVPPSPETRTTSFCTTAASPTRAGACARAKPICDETQMVSAARV